MANILMVFHSQSCRSQTLAFCCYEKAKETAQEGTTIRLRRAYDGELDDLLWADFLLLFTPENFGAIAGGMKDFLDRVFYPAERANIKAMPYCTIISAGNDGTGASRQIEKIMKGLGSEPVQPPVVFYGAPDKEAMARCAEISEALVTAVEMGIY